MRTSRSIFALMVGFALACNTPSDAQNTADKSQVQADQDRMRSQAEADKKQAEATQALTTATQEQRTTFNSLLTDLNKRETDLKANKLEKGSDTISLDHKLDVVATQRSNIQADVKSLDGATAASWDSLKTQFDKDVKSCRVALAPVIGKT